MSTFLGSEMVREMKPCMKKPTAVHAKQINKPFFVTTLEGIHEGKSGDYLVCGIKGELYPCDREIFEESYDWVNEND